MTATRIARIDAALIDQSRRLRSAYGLSASEWLVQMIVVAAAVDGYLRAPGADPHFLGAAPLPPAQAGRTSRRRVADVSRLPLETVRRIVHRLHDRGLIGEDAAGLHGTGGMLQFFVEAGLAEPALRALVAAAGGEPEIAAQRFAGHPRPIAYRLGNTCLALMLSLGRQYCLSPATLELFLRLLLEPSGARSQRHLALSMALPRETLRRHIERLATRGLVDDEHCPTVPAAVQAAHCRHPEAAERLQIAERFCRAIPAVIAAAAFAPA